MTYRTERTTALNAGLMEGVLMTREVEAIKTARDAVGVRGDELPCHADPRPWDGTYAGRAEANRRIIAAAAAACRTCPVQAECLALGRSETRMDRGGHIYGGQYFPTIHAKGEAS